MMIVYLSHDLQKGILTDKCIVLILSVLAKCRTVIGMIAEGDEGHHPEGDHVHAQGQDHEAGTGHVDHGQGVEVAGAVNMMTVEEGHHCLRGE